jgi:uncharacterized membrane protein
MPGIRLAELHPIVVHFPIALLLTSVALDFVAVALRRWSIAEAATWPLALGVVGALVAGLTGQISEQHATNLAQVGQLLSLHKTFAVASGMIFAVLLSVRLIWLSPQILGSFEARMPRLVAVRQQIHSYLPAINAGPPPRSLIWLYLAGSVIGTVCIGVTGYLGGALVYDHGVGTPAFLFILLG